MPGEKTIGNMLLPRAASPSLQLVLLPLLLCSIAGTANAWSRSPSSSVVPRHPRGSTTSSSAAFVAGRRRRVASADIRPKSDSGSGCGTHTYSPATTTTMTTTTVAALGASSREDVPTPANAAAEAESATVVGTPRSRAGKFQSGSYDRPIVLLGCSGPGDELNRLADSLLDSMSAGRSSIGGGDAAMGSVVRTVGSGVGIASASSSAASSSPSSSTVLTLSPDLIRDQIEAGKLTRSDVVVVDFNHPSFSDDNNDGANDDGESTEITTALTERLVELTRRLYEDEGLLSIYVNVHPDHGHLSSVCRKRRDALERQAFIPNSDYEICIKDEGLDPMTVLAQKFEAESSSAAVAADGDDDEDDCQDGEQKQQQQQQQLKMIRSEEDFDRLRSITSDQLDAWADVEWELSRLIARAILPPPIPGAPPSVKDAVVGQNAELTLGMNTFFLSIVFPDVNEAAPYVEAMCLDVDAMEFRADLLGKRDDRFEVGHQLQVLRRLCRPHVVRAPALPLAGLDVIDDAMPIVYTVRTSGQAGTYPNDATGISNMFDLLELGLRGGVEVLDVETGWDPARTDDLLTLSEERYTSNILGSYHVVPEEVSTEEAVRIYHRCTFGGRAHGVKVVLSIDDDGESGDGDDDAKDRQAYEAGKIFAREAKDRGDAVVPHLGLILGQHGQFSRVINERFAPVTHESLPFAAAPGQLSASEIMTLKLVMGLLQPRKFCVVGHKIPYSVSPQMQSAAFAATRLPHSYSLVDIESVEEFVESDLWADKDFGGCSVTIPHKRTIVPYLDGLSEAAEKIGAVNTVVAKEEEVEDGNGVITKTRIMYGENTDWRGIYTSLRRRLGAADRPSAASGGEGEQDSNKVGAVLIVGAGGAARAAAYAVAELGEGGYEPIYYNPRKPSKAEELTRTFGGQVVMDLEDSLLKTLEEMNGEIRVVISTLPAEADFVLPEWMVQDLDSIEQQQQETSTAGVVSPPPTCKPIVFDVNYKPYWTKLLSQADEAGLDVVRGSEMLWEQGVGQFELWTGRMAPYRVMKAVVLKNCLPKYN